MSGSEPVEKRIDAIDKRAAPVKRTFERVAAERGTMNVCLVVTHETPLIDPYLFPEFATLDHT
jgi:hypothetical protein